MENSKDLWPKDLKLIDVRPPVAVLQEQGAILARRTKNLLRGRVDQIPGKKAFNFKFVIEAPTLPYEYDLFSIHYDIEMYPLSVRFEPSLYPTSPKRAGMKELGSEDEFTQFLQKVFNSEKTRKLITALLQLLERKTV